MSADAARARSAKLAGQGHAVASRDRLHRSVRVGRSGTDSPGRPQETLKTLTCVRRPNRRKLDGVLSFAKRSMGVQIVSAADGGSSVWGRRVGGVPGAIPQTCLTSGDTILTWMTGGNGPGALTAAGLSCAACGAQLGATAKFCSECGTPVAKGTQSAEYKQVTVLFADVVRSMDIAAAVGAERLREIMAELVDRATAVVQRYGGTVDKFTGDGIMAVFGAPVALEDHAIRACLAAWAIQEEAKQLAAEVERATVSSCGCG